MIDQPAASYTMFDLIECDTTRCYFVLHGIEPLLVGVCLAAAIQKDK